MNPVVRTARHEYGASPSADPFNPAHNPSPHLTRSRCTITTALFGAAADRPGPGHMPGARADPGRTATASHRTRRRVIEIRAICGIATTTARVQRLSRRCVGSGAGSRHCSPIDPLLCRREGSTGLSTGAARCRKARALTRQLAKCTSSKPPETQQEADRLATSDGRRGPRPLAFRGRSNDRPRRRHFLRPVDVNTSGASR